jgi:exodeoxyribonuclease VII large subunit
MDVTSATATITVSDYAALIGRVVRSVGSAVIEGEVQRPKPTSRGMLFFDITDGEACLSCKVFPRQAGRLGHNPSHGDLVEIVVDRPDFWQQKGNLNLIVSDVRLTGEGELLRRREELLGRLRAEGLCDPGRRKPLPGFPRAVGVIAGRGSDGMSDVLQALRDRFPPVHIVTCAATVQGKAAPRDLIDALVRLQEHPLVDVIVMARGGGSVQDLVAFDDERLCRAIFACEKPVVTAIGHTDNAPVCNYVAWPAFTPSRSAEMVVPSAAEMRDRIDGAGRVLAAVADRIERSSERLRAIESRLAVGAVLDSRAAAVHRATSGLEGAKQAFFSDRRHGLGAAQLALASIPRRMPSAAQVGLLAAPLDARAQGYFRDLHDAVAAERRRLAACEAAIADSRSRVAELCRRLEVGTRRQLADHARDYGNALARLVRETLAGARRSLGQHSERLSSAGDGIGQAARRRLADSEQALRHVADVIDARDFRSRGWVVARGEDKEPVSSVSGLRSGSRLHLTFTDGGADTVVDTVLPDGKEKQ